MGGGAGSAGIGGGTKVGIVGGGNIGGGATGTMVGTAGSFTGGCFGGSSGTAAGLGISTFAGACVGAGAAGNAIGAGCDVGWTDPDHGNVRFFLGASTRGVGVVGTGCAATGLGFIDCQPPGRGPMGGAAAGRFVPEGWAAGDTGLGVGATTFGVGAAAADTGTLLELNDPVSTGGPPTP